jgi:hypothetical protein
MSIIKKLKKTTVCVRSITGFDVFCVKCYKRLLRDNIDRICSNHTWEELTIDDCNKEIYGRGDSVWCRLCKKDIYSYRDVLKKRRGKKKK